MGKRGLPAFRLPFRSGFSGAGNRGLSHLFPEGLSILYLLFDSRVFVDREKWNAIHGHLKDRGFSAIGSPDGQLIVIMTLLMVVNSMSRLSNVIFNLVEIM